MGAAASFDFSDNISFQESNQFYCHQCRGFISSSAGSDPLECPTCHSTFLEDFSSFSDGFRSSHAAILIGFLRGELEFGNAQALYYSQLRGMSTVNETKVLSKTMRHQLRNVVVDEGLIESSGTSSCPICTEEFQVNQDKVTQLFCLHFCHSECVLPWLEAKKTCPVCRYEVREEVKGEGFLHFTESELKEKIKSLSSDGDHTSCLKETNFELIDDSKKDEHIVGLSSSTGLPKLDLANSLLELINKENEKATLNLSVANQRSQRAIDLFSSPSIDPMSDSDTNVTFNSGRNPFLTLVSSEDDTHRSPLIMSTSQRLGPSQLFRNIMPRPTFVLRTNLNGGSDSSISNVSAIPSALLDED